jgi:protein-S-isoprenylcysteine O-methyltransferase Ste14
MGEKTMIIKNTQSQLGVGEAQETSRAAPAPIIFVAVLLVGVLLSLAFPVSFLPRVVTLLVGVAFFLLPFVLGFAVLRAMRRARTSVNPYRPTTVLLTEGPFRVSRNPMYLGMVVQYVGLALLFNSLWAMVLLPLALVIVHLTVIKREERYLELKFGEEYRAYKAKVRRWI